MLFLLSITLIAAVFTIVGNCYPTLVIVNKNIKKYMTNKYIVVLIIMLFTFFAAIRSNVGDTGTYMHSFTLYNLNIKEVFGFNQMFDFVFSGLTKYIWNDPQILVITTSLIIYPCIIWRLYKQSIDPVLTIVLFVFSVSYIGSMNGIRQYLVSAILFASYPWILKQRWYKWIFLVIFLSLFHSSVLILVPIFFVSRNNPWNRKMLYIYIIISIFFIGFNTFMPSLFSLLADTGSKYAEYKNSSYGTLSVNIFRILFAFIPVIFVFILRHNSKLKIPEINFIIIMSIFNAIFMLFAYYGAVYARFCIYFEFYPILLYPYIIKYGFRNNGSQKCAKLLLILVYLIYFYYQIQLSWSGFMLKSDWLGLVFG